MKFQWSIYWLFFAVALVSCNNKEHEARLKESAMRLDRMNGLAQFQNSGLEALLKKWIFDDYTAERYKFLQPSVKNFMDHTKRYSELVSAAIETNNISDSVALFNQYQACRVSYKFLKQKIQDSFQYVRFDNTVNPFMDMNEKTFIQKYLSGGDHLNTKLQLLFLQTDAIWNEHVFLAEAVELFTPSRNFDAIKAVGSLDKIVYKRGDRMKLTASMAEYYPANFKYAEVDGKRVETPHGFLEYSKKVNEKPGVHELRFVVSIWRKGRVESYPSVVMYKVE